MRIAAFCVLALCLLGSAVAQTGTSYQYDSLGRLRSVTVTTGAPTVYYPYDRFDNRVRVSNATNGGNLNPVAIGDGDAGYVNYTYGPYLYSNCIAVLDNDYDPDGDTLSVTSMSVVSGPLTAYASGNYICFDNANAGGYQLSYTISDGHGGTATGTIFIVVFVIP